MTLDEPANAATLSGISAHITIDEIFRRMVERHPDALALVDPPNRPQFAGGAPRQLTFHEADCIVSAIAHRLRQMGLQPDTIVAIQLPNTVEIVLTILGVLRAGMIAAPLPLLWRRADAVAALNRIDVKALITCTRAGTVNPSEHALHIAAEIFPIRYVCAFGADPPDGVVPMDDVLAARASSAEAAQNREWPGNTASHIAVLTWDVTAEGPVPVARTHLEVVAGGIGIMLEGCIGNGASILSTCAPSSFAGLSLTLVPWLLSGGTLALHHPIDADILRLQCEAHACNAIIVPATLAICLAEAGRFDACNALHTMIALWRAPERLPSSPPWRMPNVDLVDVLAFGEIGVVSARRTAGQPPPTRFGHITSPRGALAGVPVVALACTQTGTLALGGPMVPRHTFPPGAEGSGYPAIAPGPDGFIDTRYPCRADPGTGSVIVTGPPSGLVSIGGCRFTMSELQRCVGQVNQDATIAALPDAVLGHRLAASAAEPDLVRAALTALGLNPLIAGAFRSPSRVRANAA